MTTYGWSENDHDDSNVQSAATCVITRPNGSAYALSWDKSIAHLRMLSIYCANGNPSYGLFEQSGLFIGHSLYLKRCENLIS
ncbi:hypothetical protein K439DRAFT_1626567 [Ramaria rubella]|nr:hypothetical protein K439DRAFT_1626567 [Ramaria rubella]